MKDIFKCRFFFLRFFGRLKESSEQNWPLETVATDPQKGKTLKNIKEKIPCPDAILRVLELEIQNMRGIYLKMLK